MKTRFTILILLLATTLTATSCDKDDDNNYRPNEKVIGTFNSKYPDAQHVEWEIKNNYNVAEFRNNGIKTETWINSSGIWYMTESDIPFESLPEAVKTSFNASEYAQWRKEDVDKVERADMETIYVIEVEQGNQEMDLYYTEDGNLFKAVPDNDSDNYLPTSLPEEIKNFINQTYDNAPIIDMEIELGFIEVEIWDNNRKKEVIFAAKDNKWQLTTWEIRENEVPADILNLIRSRYADYLIDDIDYEEKANGTNVYLFELEKGKEELQVVVDSEGNIL
ncbi:PepSY-like domain-containing protein [Sanguibacteroides sp. AM78-02pH3A]|uniref:PepSY-like domain-containing protein n=1 Tax=Sanguibacteroides sp. AM78-02pH3A TaxID=3002646 RepID=UPI0022E580F4|nr:PepSY-like domain-containing protein [Sanguibacteroides sp. AM78-02pH3A]